MSDDELIDKLYRKYLKQGICPSGIVRITMEDLARLRCRSVFLEFYAQWCIPCRIIEPMIERLSRIYEGRVLFGRVNVDEEPMIASKFGVLSVPTIVMLRDGEEVKRVIGLVDFNTLRRLIEAYLIP